MWCQSVCGGGGSVVVEYNIFLILIIVSEGEMPKPSLPPVNSLYLKLTGGRDDRPKPGRLLLGPVVLQSYALYIEERLG